MCSGLQVLPPLHHQQPPRKLNYHPHHSCHCFLLFHWVWPPLHYVPRPRVPKSEGFEYQQSANTKPVKIAKEDRKKEMPGNFEMKGTLWAQITNHLNIADLLAVANHLVDVGDMTVNELLSGGHEIIDGLGHLLDELLLFLLLPLHLRLGWRFLSQPPGI